MFEWPPFANDIIIVGPFIALLLLTITVFMWYRLLRLQQSLEPVHSLDVAEYTCLALLAPFLMYCYSALLWSTSYGAVQWSERDEMTLLFYVFQSFIFTVAVTIIPGRVIRIIAMTQSKSLSLKRAFVRYVSHEIRSPLNVVHAGLDILRAELEGGSVMLNQINASTMELIEDIFAASETAISILNDLLHYEHMDAGTFQLERVWRPLLQGKLHWATILADKKRIKLTIADLTVASGGSEAVCDTENGSLFKRADSDELDLENNPAESQDHAFLHVDQYKIDQVIRNLITNAMKFTPAEGAVEVKIGCEMLNETNRNRIISQMGVEAVGVFRVEVVDDGAGIAVEDQQRVFGEFAQFNRNALQGGGGSGLGLWISRRIIHLHNGKLGFSSRGCGLGSSFYFELPLYSRHHVANNNSSSTLTKEFSAAHSEQQLLQSVSKVAVVNELQSPVGSALRRSLLALDSEESSKKWALVRKNPMDLWSNNGSANRYVNLAKVVPEGLHTPEDLDAVKPPEEKCCPLRILIVDDSELNRKVTLRLLLSDKSQRRLQQAEVLQADDGLSAVQLLRAEQQAGRAIQLVLMDFVMLRMHGPEAVAIMRRDLHFEGVIIGVTGNALPEDLARFVASGANEVLTKPLNRAKLGAALAAYLDR